MSVIVFMSSYIFIIMKNLKQVNRTYSLKENFKKKKKTEAVLWGKIVKKEIENRKKKECYKKGKKTYLFYSFCVTKSGIQKAKKSVTKKRKKRVKVSSLKNILV